MVVMDWAHLLLHQLSRESLPDQIRVASSMGLPAGHGCAEMRGEEAGADLLVQERLRDGL